MHAPRRPLTRLLFGSLLAALLTVLSAHPAAAGPILDRAVSALKQDPVYVDPSATFTISSSDADRLRNDIRNGNAAIFIAVLPEGVVSEAGSDASAVPQALYRALGKDGTYATVSGKMFRAGSSTPNVRAGELATLAFERRSADGLYAVLQDFVDRVQVVAAGGPSSGSSGSSGSTGDSSSGFPVGLLILGVGALVVVGLVIRSRKQKKQRFERTKAELSADIAQMGSEVLDLDASVTIKPEARDEYDAGVERFQAAQAALEKATELWQLWRIKRTIAEGKYAFERARAEIDGLPVPPPPPELTTPGPGGEPAIGLDENGQPIYLDQQGAVLTRPRDEDDDDDDDGPRARGRRRGGWYGGGYYGGGGDLLTGILIGSSMGGWGGGYHGGYSGGGGNDGDRDRGDSGWSGGGGDFGGGGGDFGGGGGGGDFGGSGGGDF